MVDRIRVGCRRIETNSIEDAFLEPAAHRPVERRKVLEPEGVRLRVSGHDVDPRRPSALDPLESIRVHAHLEKRRTFHRPRQLRVRDLVVPVSKLGIAVHAEQEVGMTTPSTVEERRLVDDVDAVAHRRDRGVLGGAQALRGREPVLRPDVN